jgi:hypothetical protein
MTIFTTNFLFLFLILNQQNPMRKIYLFVAIAFIALTTACTKEKIVEVEKIVKDTVKVLVDGNFDPNKGVLKVSFEHLVGSNPFAIRTSFTDASNNTYRFDEIRYWVSNIELFKDNGEVLKIEDGYFLIENRDTLIFHGTTAANVPNMKSPPRVRESFTIGNIPVGNYTKIKFAVGVDPKYNNNFALKAGELDINQMAMNAGWAWQTSYIFLRSKGIYLAAGGDPLVDSHKFVVETGGNASYRTVEFNLATPIISAPSKVSEVKIKANVLGLFGGGLPAVPNFTGTRPTGWTADPNLSPYNKFINAGSPSDMEKLANNAQNSFFSIDRVVQ